MLEKNSYYVSVLTFVNFYFFHMQSKVCLIFLFYPFLESPAVFNWKEKPTKLLLNLYEENKDKFNSHHYKKNVWQLIAQHMNRYNYNVTYVPCENKFKGLYATYKRIKDNNNQSGKGFKTFQYYGEIESLFSSDPVITPISQASSIEGFSDENKTPSSTETPISGRKETLTSGRKRKFEDEPEWFKRYREDAERRHEEKMPQTRKFNELFEKLIEKL